MVDAGTLAAGCGSASQLLLLHRPSPCRRRLSVTCVCSSSSFSSCSHRLAGDQIPSGRLGFVHRFSGTSSSAAQGECRNMTVVLSSQAYVYFFSHKPFLSEIIMKRKISFLILYKKIGVVRILILINSLF